MQMNEEKKTRLEKERKRVDIANKCRLAFLFLAVLGLLFIYFGNKIWEGIPWYDNTVEHLYLFLFADIFLTFLSTMVKFFFVTRYNKTVKSL